MTGACEKAATALYIYSLCLLCFSYLTFFSSHGGGGLEGRGKAWWRGFGSDSDPVEQTIRHEKPPPHLRHCILHWAFHPRHGVFVCGIPPIIAPFHVCTHTYRFSCRACVCLWHLCICPTLPLQFPSSPPVSFCSPASAIHLYEEGRKEPSPSLLCLHGPLGCLPSFSHSSLCLCILSCLCPSLLLLPIPPQCLSSTLFSYLQ